MARPDRNSNQIDVLDSSARCTVRSPALALGGHGARSERPLVTRLRFTAAGQWLRTRPGQPMEDTTTIVSLASELCDLIN